MTLRDVTPEDLPILFEHQRDPVANRMAAFPARDRDAFMAHWQTKVLGTAGTRAKTVVANGQVAGYIASWEQDGRRLVGYWIGQEHWGRGIATAALSGFLALEPARPLHAWVAVRNTGSIRVLEKCGFRPVGDPATGDDGVEEALFRLDA